MFLSGGIFTKCPSILFKTIIGVLPPATCRRMFFVCVFNKKGILWGWGELGPT